LKPDCPCQKVSAVDVAAQKRPRRDLKPFYPTFQHGVFDQLQLETLCQKIWKSALTTRKLGMDF
jgi:hypothetical protein